MSGYASLDNALFILPPLSAKHAADGRVMLPRKFLDGVSEFTKLWHGRVVAAMASGEAPGWTSDLIETSPRELPFEIQPLPPARAARRDLFRSARLVCAALVPRLVSTAELCVEAARPVVYEADMPLSAREGTIRAETRNPLLRWRRRYWSRRLEVRYRAALRISSGVQCNGLQAWKEYGPLTPRPMLYLNTRVRRSMLATPEEREARRARLLAGQPLRLVFSGRLVAMKGVLDLPRVAAALKQRQIAFTLDIFGSGDQRSDLERATRALQLADCVRIQGELPFPDLARRVARESDLFVCCHPQGDPSATFLETMSCGVPLIGYDAEGLRGILDLAGAGWLTPCGNPVVMAARIADLDANRAALVAGADRVYEFARTRTFEETMRVRVEHLEKCAGPFSLER